MNASLIQLYKVIEFDKGIAIIDNNDKLARSGVINLIVADLATCGEYLARYCFERMQGKAPREAHLAALKGARVLNKGGRVQ